MGLQVMRSLPLSKRPGIPQYGHTYLYDGGTGQRFDQPAYSRSDLHA
jgi:DNA-directed RNA polymerase subunit beta